MSPKNKLKIYLLSLGSCIIIAYMELNFHIQKLINPDNPYADISEHSLFNIMMLTKIQFYAEALSDREVMDMFGIRELSDLSIEDQQLFTYACGQSRRLAVHRATKLLFRNMEQKSKGFDSCLSYLHRFGDNWTSSEGGPAGPVKFEINLTQ